VNNLGVTSNNWIYGRVLPSDYYKDVNNNLNNGAKVCPSDKPYIDLTHKCISCP